MSLNLKSPDSLVGLKAQLREAENRVPYLNLDLNYYDHRKTIRLETLLGHGAAEYPIRLWVYCGKYHPDSGRFVGYSDAEIETIAKWPGERGVLINTLLRPEILLLEKIENGYQIHDWLEHAGHLWAFKTRAKTAAKKRWKRYATSNAKTKTSNASTCIVGNVGNVEQVEEGESGLLLPDWLNKSVWEAYREYRK